VDLVRDVTTAGMIRDNLLVYSALTALYTALNRPDRHWEVSEILSFIDEDERTAAFRPALHGCVCLPTSPDTFIAAARLLFILSWGLPEQLANFFTKSCLVEILQAVETPTFCEMQSDPIFVLCPRRLEVRDDQRFEMRRFLLYAISNYVCEVEVSKCQEEVTCFSAYLLRAWDQIAPDSMAFPILLETISRLIDYNWELMREEDLRDFLSAALEVATRSNPPKSSLFVLAAICLTCQGLFVDTFGVFSRRSDIFERFLASDDQMTIYEFLRFIGYIGSTGNILLAKIVFDELPIDAMVDVAGDGAAELKIAFVEMCRDLLRTGICEFGRLFCENEVFALMNQFLDADEFLVKFAAIGVLLGSFPELPAEVQVPILKAGFVQHLVDILRCIPNPVQALDAVSQLLRNVTGMRAEAKEAFVASIVESGLIAEMERLSAEDGELAKEAARIWDVIQAQLGLDPVAVVA
jgi:hypothetical protein